MKLTSTLRLLTTTLLLGWNAVGAWGVSASDDDLPPEPNAKYFITVKCDPVGVAEVQGDGRYLANTYVSLSATALTGEYRFVQWNKDSLFYSATADTLYQVGHADADFVALFELNPDYVPEPEPQMVYLSADPEEGVASFYPNRQFELKPDKSSYVSVSPATDYRFEGWYEADTLLSAEQGFTLQGSTSDRYLTAKLKYAPSLPDEPWIKKIVLITTQCDPADKGKVSGQGQYTAGSSASVSLYDVDPDYMLDYWSMNDNVFGSSYSFSYPVGDVDTAHFVAHLKLRPVEEPVIYHTLNLQSNPSDGASFRVQSSMAMPNDSTVAEAAQVTVTCLPNSQFTYQGMTIRGADSIHISALSHTFLMPDSDVTIVAHLDYTPVDQPEGPRSERYQLTFKLEDEIIYCDTLFWGDSIPTIETEKKEGFLFSGWSDYPDIMPRKDVLITGHYIKLEEATLFAIKVGVEGNGRIEMNPCLDSLPESFNLELKALPDYGHHFVAWRGEVAPATTSNPYRHPVVCNDSITAYFSINQHSIIYKIEGQPVDTAYYNYGDVIEPLIPAEIEGYVFVNWVGLPETMPDQDLILNSYYARIGDPCVIKTGTNGYGSVERSVEEDTLYVGDTLIVTAHPIEHYHFAYWSSKFYNSSQNPYAIIASRSDSVTAYFAINRHTITYKVDGNVLRVDTLNYGDSFELWEGPTKEHYHFTGWYQVPEVLIMGEEDIVLYGYLLLDKHRITWLSYDSTLVYNDSVYYGYLPQYRGTLPVHPRTPKYTYSFKSWSPEISIVERDTTYLALNDSTINYYTIFWNNYNDTLLCTTSVAYDDLPTYPGNTPLHDRSAKYSYTFKEWSPEITTVTGETTYTACYDSTVNRYRITWINYDDALLKVDSVEYDAMPHYEGPTLQKPPTEKYAYEFSHWSPQEKIVSGDAQYKAMYDSIPLIVSFDVDPFGYCHLQTVFIPFETLSGEVTHFMILFQEEAQAAGFKAIDWKEPLYPGYFDFPVPEEAPDGVFHAHVILGNHFAGAFGDNFFQRTDTMQFSFLIRISNKYLVQIFEDVISVDNREERFSTYQWYHDGEPIEGATLPYYQQEGGLSGEYQCFTNAGWICPESNWVWPEDGTARTKIVLKDNHLYIETPDGSTYNVTGSRCSIPNDK